MRVKNTLKEINQKKKIEKVMIDERSLYRLKFLENLK